jgi:hypothetical protein
MSELIAQLASALVELSDAKADPHVTEATYHLERAIEIAQEEKAFGSLVAETVGISTDFDEADNMCPNCVTPWKCNGPHLVMETAYAKRGFQ